MASPDPAADPSGARAGSAVRAICVRNGSFMTGTAVFFTAGDMLGFVVLLSLLSLWLVERTDAPHALLAWLFATNTVMAVTLQVRVSRGSETVDGALRDVRRSAWAFVLSCLVVSVTHQRSPRSPSLLPWSPILRHAVPSASSDAPAGRTTTWPTSRHQCGDRQAGDEVPFGLS
jgi:hypothetical protein